jgi:23S rRNA G2445 N2-methylase RlmL
LANASVLDRCTLLHQDFRQAHREIPQRTAVLTNLPYGVRLRGAKAERHGAFDALDSLLGTRPDLRPAVVISNARPPSSRRTWQAAARFSNGGLAVTAWTLP